MKISQSIIKISLVGSVLFGAAACTANYEDINRNPYEVDESEMERDGYAMRSILTSLQGWVIPVDVNTNQFTECLLAGSWSGYLADSNDGFNVGKFSTYNPQTNWAKVMYVDIIPKIFSNYSQLQTVTSDPVALAIGKVCKVMGMLRVTDCYGPIPYLHVGEDGSLTTPLDSQQEVYAKMFEELDEAIEALTANRTASIIADADKIYAGSAEKWCKLANSLKLRMAMRIVYADAATAQARAEEAVNSEVGVMTSVADNASYTGFGKDGNPFYKIMYEYNGGDSRIGADITSFMNGYNDPRRAAMFTTSTFNSGVNGYFGLRSGITIPASPNIKLYSNYNLTASSSMIWMNSAEVAFLRAEGALRGWNMGGTAQSFYEQGIRLSFEQWGASGVDGYLTDAASIPAGYKDPALSFDGSTASTITIAWNDADDFETSLERIITQKWIANFPLGHEAWAEYRRTGYPKLMPVVTNLSNGVVDSNVGPRRLSYPLEEYTSNGDNVNEAVAKYFNGRDNMASKVWWDCM